MTALDLLVPPRLVDPIGSWGLVAHLLLLFLALGVSVGVAIWRGNYRGHWAAVLIGPFLAFFPVLRFFRAIAPDNHTWTWIVVGVVAVLAAVLVWVAAWAGDEWPPLAGALLLLSVGVAWAIDKWEEKLASIPLSWGAFIGLVFLVCMLVASERR